MACSLRVVCVSSGGTSPCIVLTTDSQRFLFDSGEGVQRLCIEHRVRLSKVDGVFLTVLSQETVAGLPGLTLTCAESGRNGMNIIGPRGLQSFWNSTSSFTSRPQFSVSLHEKLSSFDSMEFDKVLISCLSIGSQFSHLCYVIDTKVLPGKFDIERAKELGVPIGPLLGQLQNGKNVTLSNGRIVTPEEVVAAPEKSRYSFIICNCSADENTDCLITSLVTNLYWDRFYVTGENHDQVDCIIHLSPSKVTKSSPYTEWMMKFSNSTCHVMVGEGDCRPHTAFQASTIYTSKLHKLFPEVFPVLEIGDGHPTPHENISHVVAAYPGLTYNLLPRRVRGLELVTSLSPTGQHSIGSLVDEEVIKFWNDLQGNDQSSPLTSSISASREFQQQLMNHILPLDPLRSHYCEDNAIIFLGTGCAQPSKYRNVSGIFVQLDGGGMLLDCGEGTWQQLIRMASYTPSMLVNSDRDSRTPECWAASQLKVIWISHPHADHHLGVIRVISERKRILSSSQKTFQPLLLIAPESVLAFVKAFEEYDPLLVGSYYPVNIRCFDQFELSLRCNPCEGEDSFLAVSRYYGLRQSSTSVVETQGTTSRKRRVFDTPELLSESLNQLAISQPILSSLGIDTFENLQVIHCSQSYAASVVSKKGWKLVYSGDTRPSARLVELGHGATILIHEATFSDCKADEAVKKRHSTISEAIEVAKQMNAQRLILTHFSQRYPSTPPLPPQCLDYQNPSVVKVILADCYWAHCMNTVLTLAFPPEEEEPELEDGDDSTQRSSKRSQTPRNSSVSEDRGSHSSTSQSRKSKKFKSDRDGAISGPLSSGEGPSPS